MLNSIKKMMLIYLICITTLLSQELITPIPHQDSYDYKKALLGEKLFFDTRLSHDNTISCANCHLLEDGGDDNLEVSFGIDGKTGTRNAPTILNARYNSFQLWDGSAKNLAEQVNRHINNPVEFGSSFKEVIAKIQDDLDYYNTFFSLYKDGITASNIADAISEFEKTLITPNAPFDKYLRGDKEALSKDELDGYEAFKENGCLSCHNGINVGGNLMQKIGVINKFGTTDYGKYNVTKKEEDRFYFKVPSLRNVELTAPYFHDGKTKTLRDAVDKMILHQVGFMIEDKDTENIVKFLKTLTGEKLVIIKENR